MTPLLPSQPYPTWVETKRTLHLVCQIVGKFRMALTPRQNHWWHVPLYVTSRGLATGTLHAPNDPLLSLDIEVDLLDHDIVLRSNRAAGFRIDFNSYPCSGVYARMQAAMSTLGVDVGILPKPYDLSYTDRPFPEDHADRTYDPAAAARYFRMLAWVDRIFDEYRGGFLGKQTPSHLFWHSFDLAVTRFSGRENPKPPAEFRNPRDAEAYSHEVVSIGFWPGDDAYPHAAFYGYASPEPAGLAEMPLPVGTWIDVGGSHLARVDYETIRQADDPRVTLLGFLNAVYDAAAELGEWPDLKLPESSRYDP
jgi:hypothetical protein